MTPKEKRDKINLLFCELIRECNEHKLTILRITEDIAKLTHTKGSK